MSLIEKPINKEKITDKDIAEELYEICDRVHSSCYCECPIYEKFNEIPWNKEKDNCKFFKDGKSMLKELRKKIISKKWSHIY